MHRTTPLLLLALLACGRRAPDPDHALYVRQLTPLLDDNGLLAERMLRAAAELHAGRATSAQALERWRDEVVPLAHHLHDQASLVQPPDPWVAPHERLTGIWETRATGYQLVLDGVEMGDESRFKRGRALADRAKLDEESWFQDANASLLAHGLLIDQFP